MVKTFVYMLRKVDGEKGASPASQRPLSPGEDDEEETDRSPARPSTLGVRPKPGAPPRVKTFRKFNLRGKVESCSLFSPWGAGEIPR